MSAVAIANIIVGDVLLPMMWLRVGDDAKCGVLFDVEMDEQHLYAAVRAAVVGSTPRSVGVVVICSSIWYRASMLIVLGVYAVCDVTDDSHIVRHNRFGD